MLEAIIILIAWIVALIIFLSPVILIGVIIYLYKKRKNRKPERKDNKFQSEWVWDENRQLWVHESEFAKQIHIIHNSQTSTRPSEPMVFYPRKQTQSEGTYRYDYFHIPDEQQSKFHHDDTSFKSEATVTINIPKEVLEKAKNASPNHHNERKSEYQDAYKATPIMTQNEMRNYRTLNEAAVKKGYIVWPKVRLADIITPRTGEKYMSYFGKIKSKHVDFVIADENARIKAVIELDDSSHDRKDRKERDDFVDTILQDCGYKIIHTRYIWPDILDNI